MQELLLHYATHPCVSMKVYYTQIPVGWVRSQHVMLMWRGRATRLSDCGVWEVIPWRPLCTRARTHTHTDTQKHPYTVLSDMNSRDPSAPARRIVAPGMTAEPLSLSWLLSVETHIHTNTHISYNSSATSTSTSTPAGPFGSISLSLPACQAA